MKANLQDLYLEGLIKSWKCRTTGKAQFAPDWMLSWKNTWVTTMLVYDILAFNPFLEALNFLDCLALILPLNPKGLENALAFYLSFVFP